MLESIQGSRPQTGPMPLNIEEIDLVSGAVNWGEFWGGAVTLAGTAIAIAAAPETAGTSLLLLGAVAGGASAGIQFGLATQ